MKNYIFSPYRSIFLADGGDVYFYVDSKKRVILIGEEASEIFIIQNDQLVSIGYTWEDSFQDYDYEPATRKEIKEAGLWDFVENKEDYSSEQEKINDELEEYLRIGEEIEKEKQNTDAGVQ